MSESAGRLDRLQAMRDADIAKSTERQHGENLQKLQKDYAGVFEPDFVEATYNAVKEAKTTATAVNNDLVPIFVIRETRARLEQLRAQNGEKSGVEKSGE